ncbi:MAG: LysM peptidoglycan-binding domain-containing protein [Cyclobacteriaceae bacterium]
MKITAWLIAFILTVPAWASDIIPRVPNNIKVAGISLKITAEAQRQIQKDVDALRASEKYFQIKLDRVNLYFPIIEKILKEEGVPDDLKYLSVQESALISDAKSSAGAVGYWQFKDFTAREVGLRVDGKVDERKNIAAASRGAAKYFKRNNYYVKNWIYAVNAYMTGPAGVKKYVDEKDIGSSKMVISGKTHWYVKRFIAHVIAFKDEVGAPHSEGLKLVVYEKGENKTLDHIARDLKVDPELLKDYNKWLKHGKVPDDKEYSVIIPVKGRVPAEIKDKDIKTNADPPPLSRKIKEPLDNGTNSTAEPAAKTVFIKRNDRRAVMAAPGDNVVSLALKANILSRQLIKFNDLSSGQRIESGEVYYAQKKRNRSNIEFHVAQHGESLWDISQKYGVKLKKLLKKNRMESPDELKPGRVIWMKNKRPQDTPISYKKVKKVEVVKPKKVLKNPPVVIPDSPSAKEKPETTEPDQPTEQTADSGSDEIQSNNEIEARVNTRTHVVQPGESLWGISKKYNVSVDKLRAWNNIKGTDGLHPNQELVISAAEIEGAPTATVEKPVESEPSKPKVHMVQPGESLWAISRKYDLTVDQIKEWNGMSESGSLHPGQELKLTAVEQEAATKPATEEPANSIQPKTYTVEPGDTLYGVAQKFGLSTKELKSLNAKQSNELSVGEELKVSK